MRPAASAILYDDNGAHPGMTTAEFMVEAGVALDVVTPERTLAPDVGGTSFPAYFKALNRAGASITINLRLERLERRGNKIVATFFDEYGGAMSRRRPTRSWWNTARRRSTTSISR